MHLHIQPVMDESAVGIHNMTFMFKSFVGYVTSNGKGFILARGPYPIILMTIT